MPCPICRRPALPRAQNGAAPFCSTRCKQIDLGQWLSDCYRVAGTEDGESTDLGEDPRTAHDAHDRNEGT